ncbi:hypothetical protein AZ78_1925 [Lysobacter capsici AZ78]|uniref:Uncharacterized protein n=1 Tax=Lysobacter capsici AZ78 TaxID=1444315 RepID=A0A108U885_9GAMM|nr:hypothetical protein AZ78_1925 [Lysobacter capsici AZ78]
MASGLGAGGTAGRSSPLRGADAAAAARIAEGQLDTRLNGSRYRNEKNTYPRICVRTTRWPRGANRLWKLDSAPLWPSTSIAKKRSRWPYSPVIKLSHATDASNSNSTCQWLSWRICASCYCRD